MDGINPVLAHKIGLDEGDGADAAAASPVSPARQMRRAMARAADKSVGLLASVLGIADDEADVETLIEDGPKGWVVLGLREGGQAGLTGLMLLDPDLRSALVEVQTMGSLLPKAETPRPVTRVDAVMTVPFASQFLSELNEAGFQTGGIGLDRYEIGPIEDLRTAGLVMVQGMYRTWRVTVQIGGGELQGELLIAVLPSDAAASTEDTVRDDHWSTAFRGAVAEAPVDLDAVLGSLRMPIAKVEAFEVGQVIALPGTTVGSVTLRGAGGEVAASARLGQIAGKRAVRIEEHTVEMEPDGTPYGDGAPPAPTPAPPLPDAMPDASFPAAMAEPMAAPPMGEPMMAAPLDAAPGEAPDFPPAPFDLPDPGEQG